jgi:hypothetical protein
MDVCRTLDMIINKLKQVLRVRRNINWSPKGFIPVTMQRTHKATIQTVYFSVFVNTSIYYGL